MGLAKGSHCVKRGKEWALLLNQTPITIRLTQVFPEPTAASADPDTGAPPIHDDILAEAFVLGPRGRRAAAGAALAQLQEQLGRTALALARPPMPLVHRGRPPVAV